MPDEQEAIEIYLALETDTAYVELCLKEAMADLGDAPLTFHPEQREKAWSKFKTLLTAKGAIPMYTNGSKWLTYAAAITMFLLTATLVFYLRQSTGVLQNIVIYQRIKAGYGKIEHITLPDSSHLSLFPGAVVDIPNNFNARNRKVFLNGRAYFEVTHNKQKPFYVRTSKVTTRVLGTSFEVNAAKEAEIASVTLRTGRVAVSNKFHKLAILQPGQKLTYHQVTGKYVMEQVQPNKLLRWVKGELTFEQTNFAEICLQLEKWYHISIKVQNKQLLQKNITANFKGQSAKQVLDILSATAGFNYKASNNIIHIY
ncbi:FecR family protein [Mucilaginibacter galii]